MRREGAGLRTAPSGRSQGYPNERAESVVVRLPPARGASEGLLMILRSEDRPLTARQVAGCAGISVDEAAAALEGLCAEGSVRRLNTVVETFTARFL